MKLLIPVVLLSAVLFSLHPHESPAHLNNSDGRAKTLAVQAETPRKESTDTDIDVAIKEKALTEQQTISKPEKQAAATQEPVKTPEPAPQPTNDIPAQVFCGSPAQRNTKNIMVANALIGKQMAEKYGWTGNEWKALLELWSCESSWTHTAINPDSGAGGIPQSWPASKMASSGQDWQTNPSTQIEWGLKYIASRYAAPSAALSFHYKYNYY